MNVGYTGPETGMTEAQKKQLRKRLRAHAMLHAAEKNVLHHGDCEGGDMEAQDIATEDGWIIEIWPPSNDRKRGFGAHRYLHNRAPRVRELHDPKPYLVRDWDIAAQDELIATVGQMVEPVGGARRGHGTWATVTRARKQGTPVVIIWPDGSETVEEGRERLEGT